MRLEFVDPFEGLNRLREGLDQLFEESFGVPARAPAAVYGRWAPRMDIHESAEAITVTAELPGMTRDDINIELTADSLSISGERKRAALPAEHRLHRAERAHGPFARSFSIGVAVDPEKASAKLTDGVLTLDIPKAPQAVRRAIEVSPE